MPQAYAMRNAPVNLAVGLKCRAPSLQPYAQNLADYRDLFPASRNKFASSSSICDTVFRKSGTFAVRCCRTLIQPNYPKIRFSGHQMINRRAQSINISPGINHVSCRLFWRTIVGRTKWPILNRSKAVFVDAGGNAKIGQFMHARLNQSKCCPV